MEKNKFIRLYAEKQENARKEWTSRLYYHIERAAVNDWAGLEKTLLALKAAPEFKSRPPIIRVVNQALNDLRS